MSDKSPLITAAIGAVVGGCLGFLFFTASGRRLRDDIGRTLDRVAEEFDEVQALAQRLRGLGEQYRRATREAFVINIASQREAHRAPRFGA